MKSIFASVLGTSCFLGLILIGTSSSIGQEPSWYPYVIARGQDRQLIQATPMEERPFRPFHFYGNAMRRTAHYGTPVPMGRVLQTPLIFPRVLGERLVQPAFRRF